MEQLTNEAKNVTPEFEAQQLMYSFSDILPTTYNAMLEIGEADNATAKACAIFHCKQILALPGMSKNKYWPKVLEALNKF